MSLTEPLAIWSPPERLPFPASNSWQLLPAPETSLLPPSSAKNRADAARLTRMHHHLFFIFHVLSSSSMQNSNGIQMHLNILSVSLLLFLHIYSFIYIHCDRSYFMSRMVCWRDVTKKKNTFWPPEVKMNSTHNVDKKPNKLLPSWCLWMCGRLEGCWQSLMWVPQVTLSGVITLAEWGFE